MSVTLIRTDLASTPLSQRIEFVLAHLANTILAIYWRFTGNFYGGLSQASPFISDQNSI